MRKFAARQPVLFSLLAIILPVAGMKAANPLLAGYFSELTARLLVEALFCIYVAALVTILGWWREIGLNGPRNWRGLAAFAPWLLLLLLVVAGRGVHLADSGRMLAFGALMLMVGFAEEVLMRGVVLQVLCPAGVMRAVLVSSLLFGAGHLLNLFAGHALEPTLIQFIYATFIGIGMAGPRLYAGTIVPAILLHALIDFSDDVARGFVLTAPKVMTLHAAAGAIVITGLYAVYGWWLTRRARVAGVA
jgi:membrane protease YdiL (CAAX protease family)